MRVRKRLLGSVLTVMLTTATVGSALAQQAPDEQVDSPPTGLVGRVVLATRCPVPVGDADDGVCPAPGLQSTVTVRSGDGSTAVAQVATDEAGGFSIPLDPGDWKSTRLNSSHIPLSRMASSF